MLNSLENLVSSSSANNPSASDPSGSEPAGSTPAGSTPAWETAELRAENARLRRELETLRLGDRKGFEDALEQAKLDAMKELAYGASHEINNPLANIAGRAQTLLKSETDENNRRMLESIHRQAMRAHEMISDLMLFARPPKLERQAVSPAELVTKLIEELQPLADEHRVQMIVQNDRAPSSVAADPVQLAVAIKALLVNSIEAIGQDGEIAVGLRQAEATLEETLEIKVRDTGPGIPAAVRPHVFDPFYSGREAGRGLGFGLSKCWRIVTDHGGRITVDSPPAQGAVFTIHLPVHG